MSSTPFTEVEKKWCREYSEYLFKHNLAQYFIRPVDPKLDQAQDYFDHIKEPMDLGTILSKFKDDKYKCSREWVRDVNLVWENAMTYNQKKTLIYRCASLMQEKTKAAFKHIPQTDDDLWVLKLEKANKKLQSFLNFSKVPPPDQSQIARKPELAIRP